MNLEQIISSCIQNQAVAQRQLYQYLAPKLFGVCLKYARNNDEAKDHLQESFLLIFKNLKQLSESSRIDFWAKKITINYCISQYKKNLVFSNQEEFPDLEEDQKIEEEIPIEELLKLIQELPDQYRLVFNLFVLDNYSHKEIAKMLAISEGTSKSNLSRAKMILKQKIMQQQKNTLYHHE